MTVLLCQGCGVDLPPPKGPGRRPKWCSDKCRKRQYAGTCVSCGGVTNANGSGGTHPPDHCARCDAKLVRDRAQARYRGQNDRIAELYRAGVPLKDIAAEFGWNPSWIQVHLHRMRRYGYDLPHRNPGSAEAGRRRWAREKAAA